jgi:hypothetical protein
MPDRFLSAQAWMLLVRNDSVINHRNIAVVKNDLLPYPRSSYTCLKSNNIEVRKTLKVYLILLF